jgi:membrane protease YdiL (CAAX protease family)
MFTKLTDTSKAAIFSVLVLLMAVGDALLLRMLDLPQNTLTGTLSLGALWMCTPTVATFIMLLVVTREGYSKEGWRSLGLHRLGLSVWWIAFGVSLLITVAASAIVWATPLFIQIVLFTLTLVLFEEIGMRGYLLPKLLSLGRTRALALSGLVWATWHMPIYYFLAPLFPVGNVLLFLPLFFGSIVAASFIFGYLRIYTGSVWPASIAHAVHNAAWGTFAAFTATSYPVLVNLYLVGDYGILIVVGAVVAAIGVGYILRSGLNKSQPSGASGEVLAAPEVTAAPR